MGQYYKAYVKQERAAKVYQPKTFKSGRKLTEFSWILNPFVGYILSLIHNNPANIAFVGDCSKEDKKLRRNAIYNRCWAEGAKIEKEPEGVTYTEDPFNAVVIDFDIEAAKENGYLLNHQKKQFVSLHDFFANAIDKEGWCMHPLSLLTAIGNGLGGGDYHGRNEEMIGYWALDKLELKFIGDDYGKTLHGYTDITSDVIFIED